jgi:hypothetical protein
MRLWKALRSLYRGKKGVRRAAGPHPRLAVEALDQRLLPSVDAFIWFPSTEAAAPMAPKADHGLIAHRGGPRVSSHQVAGSGGAVNRHGHSSAGIGHAPTESITFVYGSLARSFSWGAVNSPD